MARKSPATRDKRKQQVSRRRDRKRKPYVSPFGNRHYQLFGGGLLVIAVGFVTMGFGSITLAPLLMIVGYCVLIPMVLMWNPITTTGTEAEQKSPQP